MLGRVLNSFSSLIQFYEDWQWDTKVIPYRERIEAHLPDILVRYQQIQFSFLNREPVHSNPDVASHFYTQSYRKDAAASARRYALNIQSRGTHLVMRNATTKLQHVQIALTAKHPNLLVAELLEPPWRFVFDQVETAFSMFGLADTWTRLNSHRDSMLSFWDDIARELEPLRQEFEYIMPELNSKISGHLHIPLFYSLLRCVGYPNPDLAFRLYVGSPILGEFYSPALLQREVIGEAITDENIRRIARSCRAQCDNISATLSTLGADACMAKMHKEFRSNSLVGPFRTFRELVLAIQDEIRQHDGLESFVLEDEYVIVGPQFTIEELHAFQESAVDKTDIPEVIIRNIWNGKTHNNLTSSYSTYVPNNHADVSVIVLHWISVFTSLNFPFEMLGYKSDFTGAYRQMPLRVMHLFASASCFWNYDKDYNCRCYAFYRSLPFGSSLAPAGWSEIVFALCYILAFSTLTILTHCVDDVCGIEVQETVMSARTCFLELCAKIGFVIDMKKSPLPLDEIIYLGLMMHMPARIPRADIKYFSLSVTDERRIKLIQALEDFLFKGTMTPGEASSFRGKLMFYTFWNQEARSYLSELAARQYSESSQHELTEDLARAIQFFITLLCDKKFIAGIQPEHIFGRLLSILYTDGALEGNGLVKGTGGVLFHLPMTTPLYFGEKIPLSACNFDHIAPIEMHAIFRSLELFGSYLRDRAVILFVDNTHAIGCLLKRSATVRERGTKRAHDGSLRGYQSSYTPYSHFSAFCKLEVGIRRTMNEQARAIWKLCSDLNLMLWIEYVHTDCNIADPPSRGQPLPMRGIHVSEAHRLFRTSEFD